MRVVLLGVICLALGACSIALDNTSGVFSTTPGKYDFLDCPGIQGRIRGSTAREQELINLMERAKQDAFGPVVNTLVYQDELNQVRADQHTLMKAADEKRCTPDVKPTATSLAPVH